MAQSELKALLCCRACSPGRGSEPGMGWNFAMAAATFCETHVIVNGSYREVIENYCHENPETTKNLVFHFFVNTPPGKVASYLQQRFPSLYYYYEYLRWQKNILPFARELESREHFSLVHQVTLAGYRMPGYLHLLKKPLLWGPVGGLNNAPYRFLPSLKLRDILYYGLRNLINSWQKHCGYAACVYSRYADYILTSTQDGMQDVRRYWKRPAEYMCEIGTMTEEEHRCLSVERAADEPLRLCWVGIMNNGRKNLPMLFRALRYCSVPVEIHIMGDGVYRRRWEEEARRMLPSRHRAVFYGNVAQQQVYEQMKQSHAFCITSVKDDTSSVLLEAMQHALPVVAPDSCGFAGVITEESGIKISIDWPETFAKNYGRALERIGLDEAFRQRLCQGARKRANDFTWACKTARLKEIYTAVAAGQRP